jgi:hypothetical protein
MLVYQALLLGGYAYAHWIGRLRPRKQAGLHLGLFAVAALWLPLGLLQIDPPLDFAPALWVPWLLIASIGPLFFIVSAQAPLMQRWYALESSRANPTRSTPLPIWAASQACSPIPSWWSRCCPWSSRACSGRSATSCSCSWLSPAR